MWRNVKGSRESRRMVSLAGGKSLRLEPHSHSVDLLAVSYGGHGTGDPGTLDCTGLSSSQPANRTDGSSLLQDAAARGKGSSSSDPCAYVTALEQLFLPTLRHLATKVMEPTLHASQSAKSAKLNEPLSSLPAKRRMHVNSAPGFMESRLVQ